LVKSLIHAALKALGRESKLKSVHGFDETQLAESITQSISYYPCFEHLSDDQSQRLNALSLRFIAEKQFICAPDLLLTPRMLADVAAQACLLVLELDRGLDWYSDFKEIVLYPAAFFSNHEMEDEHGVVHIVDEAQPGQVLPEGPVLLSYEDVLQSANGECYNVVIHEFAHKLDAADGTFDGTPPLPNDITRAEWVSVWQTAFEDFRLRVDEAERLSEQSNEDHGDGEFEDDLIDESLDPYAAENPAEFFGVMTEAFFNVPHVLRDEYPQVFDLLQRFYRQTPLEVR
jgi:MtfA peptidase